MICDDDIQVLKIHEVVYAKKSEAEKHDCVRLSFITRVSLASECD